MNMYHNMYFYFSNTGSIFKCVLIQFRERFCFQRWAHICCLFSYYLPLDSIDKPFFFFSHLSKATCHDPGTISYSFLLIWKVFLLYHHG